MFKLKRSGLPLNLIAIALFLALSTLAFAPVAKANADSSNYLLGHWLLDEQSAGSCSSGGDSCDTSGNGNDGVWENNPTPTVNGALPLSSFSNGALDFNGSNYVQMNGFDASDLGGSNFTISFWMNPTSWDNGNSPGIIDMKTGDSSNGLTIYSDNGQGMHIDARVGQQNNFVSNSDVTLNQWNNWVLERQGDNLYWYLNGVLDASGTTNVTLNDNEPLEIGHTNTWGGYFQGGVEDVRIYSVALTPSAIQSLSNGTDLQVTTPVASTPTIGVKPNQSVEINASNYISGSADPSSLSIISSPTHGTVTNLSGAAITYSPDNGYTGTDSLTYQICSSLSLDICTTARIDFDVEPSASLSVVSSGASSNKDVHDPETGYGEPRNYTFLAILTSLSLASIATGVLLPLRQQTASRRETLRTQ